MRPAIFCHTLPAVMTFGGQKGVMESDENEEFAT
jgi:hypothetical protein